MPRPTIVVLGLSLGLACTAGLPVPAGMAQAPGDRGGASSETYLTAPAPGAMRKAPFPGDESRSRSARQLDPDELARYLAAMGYSDIRNVRQRGPTYIADARDPSGARVRLVIGPNGRIIGTQYLDRR